MQVKEAVQQRRSIKHFDTNHVVTEKEIHELLSHAICPQRLLIFKTGDLL